MNPKLRVTQPESFKSCAPRNRLSGNNRAYLAQFIPLALVRFRAYIGAVTPQGSANDARQARPEQTETIDPLQVPALPTPLALAGPAPVLPEVPVKALRDGRSWEAGATAPGIAA
jgi:hypothetical protein